MKYIARILAATAFCCLAAACTTPATTDKVAARAAVVADGSFDGTYQRRNVGEWADADLVISDDGGSFRTFGSDCHRGGSPIKIVEQTPTMIRFNINYQGSIAGCADAKIGRFKKVVIDGKKALQSSTSDSKFIKQ